MARKLHADQHGMAVHFIIAVVVLLAAFGGVGYYVMSKNKKTDSSKSGSTQSASTKDSKETKVASEAELDAAAVAAFKCPYDDKDVCKFLGNFSGVKDYTIVMEGKDAEGNTTKGLFQVDGKNSVIAMDFLGGRWETITHNDNVYTKSTTGTWWKSAKSTTSPDSSKELSDSLTDVSKALVSEEDLKTTSFTRVGEEACGNLKCLKYKSVDSTTPADVTYVWFDTKNHLLRKMVTESPESGSMTMTMDYKNVSVSAPSPVKDLAPNQYIMPGSAEPVTI